MGNDVRKLNLKINTEGLELGEEEKKLSPIELCTRIIGNVMFGYSTQVRGLSKSERQQFWKINKLFDKAVKENIEVVELDVNDSGFIRKCFRETKLNPNNLLERVEATIDAIEGYTK